MIELSLLEPGAEGRALGAARGAVPGARPRQVIVEPLEGVSVRVSAPADADVVSVRARDSLGGAYFSCEAPVIDGRAGCCILARGALGTHRVLVRAGSRRAEARFRLGARTRVLTDSPNLGELSERVRAFLAADTTTFLIDGRAVTGYRSPDTKPIWLRDHTHQLKAAKYFHADPLPVLDHFLSQQREDGSLWDYVDLAEGAGQAGPFAYARCAVESDVEYLMVEAAYAAWQATGDDAWMARALPGLEKAIGYSTSDPWRWNEEMGLVQRPFTVDTWDYEYGNHAPWRREAAHMCIMHGDNSGVVQACRQLGRMRRHLGDDELADAWEGKAEDIRRRANDVCWNGRFYAHQVHVDPVDVPGVDESQQLSLSNPYDINRGLPTHEMAVSIIREYISRRERQGESCFAEWFSIDPPFPTDSFDTAEGSWVKYAGEYTNGGILPLVGGELARAAFEHGFESYALDILSRYGELTERTGESYLWYHRDGRPGHSSGSTLATDGWGAAAMHNALVGGLAGVEDLASRFGHVRLSPRWAVAGATEAHVVVRYPASDGYVAYRYEVDEGSGEIAITYTGMADRVDFHVLLPGGASAKRASINGRGVRFRGVAVGSSRYCDFSTRRGSGQAVITYQR